MHWLVPIGSILGALALGTVSPGPSFLFVARTSVAKSRRDGIAAAFGMGVGGVIFATLALLGVHAVFAAVPWLFLILKAAGALYLMHLGVGAWRAARNRIEFPGTLPVSGSEPSRHSFRRGLLTQLSNPKTAVVYGSVFAALLPADLPRWVSGSLPVIIFGMETSWYCIVAVALSSTAARSAYLEWKTPLDRAAGAVMALLGVKLLLSASTEAGAWR